MSVSHSDVTEMRTQLTVNRYLSNKENIAPQRMRSLVSENILLSENESLENVDEVDPTVLNAIIDSNRKHEPFAVLWEKPSTENKQESKSLKPNNPEGPNSNLTTLQQSQPLKKKKSQPKVAISKPLTFFR